MTRSAARENAKPPERSAAADLDGIVDRLLAAHRRLRRRSVASIIESLERVADRWMDPQSDWRRSAERDLPGTTGFSPEMIRFALPWMIEPLRAPALGRLLDAELGNRRALDAGGAGRRAVGPTLIVHILAGNLAGAAAVPLALGLTVKSSVLLKAASGDRVFPELFVRSVADTDPELGACAAAVYWRGGDAASEKRAFAAAELVVASGSDASVDALRARCPARFIGHGHRASVAVIGREILADPTRATAAADALALDISVWDQRGCLSPHVCFIEGQFEDAQRFGTAVAAALDAWATRLPPGTLTLDERAAVRRFRDETEWLGLSGRPATLFASRDSADWSVAIEGEAAFRPTPLCRSLRVCPVASLEELPTILAPVAHVLAAAGIAVDGERMPRLQRILAGARVPWTPALGRMQRPPLEWPQGGRPRVAEWISWTDEAPA